MTNNICRSSSCLFSQAKPIKWQEWTFKLSSCNPCMRSKFLIYLAHSSSGLLERADPRGGLLGATFQCLLGEQFKSLKCGDRFWHENEPRSDIHTEATALTPCQLNEIRKTLVSKIICETSDDITAVNRFAFQQTGIKTPCDKLPEVNLEPWMPGFKCEIEES